MSRPSGLSGVLVVDKQRGLTSFDVVALVRRTLGVRRVGHAGTLDPDATGVLPVLVGEATKLTPYLFDHDKAYRATVRLGITTDTLDLTGRVLATTPVPPIARDELDRVLARFVGRIKQTPPMYSAAHHAGRRLYELARAGVEVAREPREVLVHELRVERLDPPTVVLAVVCGKGTYVRALAADIGAALGCGAAIEGLVRTRVGDFLAADAVPSGDIPRLGSAALASRLLPPEAALARWPAVRLGEQAAAAFLNGQAVESGVPAPAGLLRVHATGGAFLGIGRSRPGTRLVQAVRLLHAHRPGPSVLPA